jgi:AcrR family transcriptional regulator
MTTHADLAERILNTALELGEVHGWDELHLHDIARTLDLTLADIHRHYSQKDDLAEAWFDRADRALVSIAASPGWESLSPRDRLFRAIMAWLDALAPHRELSAAMLRYKFQPEHLHLQALGVTRVSRTVQWIREAACLPGAGLRRELEETALTATYLITFARWLRDDSPGAQRTRDLLDRLLTGAERAAQGLDSIMPAGRTL